MKTYVSTPHCLPLAFRALRFAWSILFLWTLLVAIPAGSFAQPPSLPYSVDWQDAVNAYQSKDFAKARGLFEKILNQGHSSASLYFNLGDTYYQLGQPGLAAWMWEKTLVLDPRNADARHNLTLVRPAKDGAEPQTFFMFWSLVWLWGRYTAGEWAFLLGVLHALTALFAVGWIVLRAGAVRRFSRAACLTGLAAMVVCAAFFVPRLADAEWHRYGVVVQNASVVRSAPGPDEPAYFEAPAGERLEVWDAPVRGWLRVQRRSDGRVGFLPEESIRPL